MAYAALGFGKYGYFSLPQVIFTDPDYFFWAIDNQAFSGSQMQEAKALLKRIRRIRIPGDHAQGWCADHVHQKNKLIGLYIVLKDQSCTYPSCEVTRLPYIDLGFVHEHMPRDRQGNTVLVSTYLRLRGADVMGVPTRAFCYGFFDDPGNFV